jgi:subtilase family serine protease
VALAVTAASLAFVAAASAAIEAPDGKTVRHDTTTPDCTSPPPVHTYAWEHCYTPADIRDAYGVSSLGDPFAGTGTLGQGRTIVLIDSYGSPTAASDLKFFHDTFYPNLPDPNFTTVYPLGKPNFKNTNGKGLSGPNAAGNWSGEATLDSEWSYAIAPLAHIVLVGVPPAETEGVQGLPNMFKAIQGQIASEPAGTVFSMSFAITEQTFGGAAKAQTKRFDAVFKQGNAKGDTFFGSSGDNGTDNASKKHRETVTYPYATDQWPTSSPYVTSAGGTQLQYHWVWGPTSDTPYLSDGTTMNPAYFNSTSSGGVLNAVWNESWLPAATGGGPSAIYARPSWQDGVLPSAGNHRLVPDMSWNAAVNGGVLVYITAYPSYQRSGWHVYGGTSAASPQLAALTALADQERAAANKSFLGNINPLIYAHPGWFTDVKPIVEGTAASGHLVNNQLWQYNADGSVSPSPVPGWPTLTGYDMTTGLGTPWAPDYVAGLAGS